MQYIHVQTQQEYDQLMDIFQKNGRLWITGYRPKDHNAMLNFKELWIKDTVRFVFRSYLNWDEAVISFNDYMKQEIPTPDDTIYVPQFWDLVDVRDSDIEEWDNSSWYYVGTIEWLHICTPYEDRLKKFLWCDNYMNDFAPFRQVRKHEEEKVTITITKSEYEKVKEFLNK